MGRDGGGGGVGRENEMGVEDWKGGNNERRSLNRGHLNRV